MHLQLQNEVQTITGSEGIGTTILPQFASGIMFCLHKLTDLSFPVCSPTQMRARLQNVHGAMQP